MWALTDVLILFGVGAFGGLLAGLLGVGGGLIYIAAFTYYLGQYDLPSAEFVRLILANSIFAVFFAGLSGTIRQAIQGNFYFRETIITAIPGTLGALLVSYGMAVTNWYTQEKFSILVLGLLAVLAYRMFKRSQSGQQEASLVMDDLPAKHYALSGFLSGALSAASGFGGGIVLIGIMPFYTLAMSLFYGLRHGDASLAIPGMFGYLLLPMVLPLVFGVILFTPVGVWLAQKLPGHVLQMIFATVIVLVSIQVVLEHLLHAF